MNDCQIIIVMDGIDHLKDIQTKMMAIPAFWLPKKIPLRFKFILTLNEGHQNIEYFEKINARFMKFSDSSLNLQNIMSLHIMKFRYLLGSSTWTRVSSRNRRTCSARCRST